MGTPMAAVASLERCISDGHEVAAVYTQPDRPSGRGNKIVFSPVKQCAIDHEIAVFQPEKVRTPDALEVFRSHRAEAAVVVAYGRILPEGFLNAFPKGAINVHFSLLPKYRGAAPVNWAIVNGETETGVTTMQMDAGLDTGDILMQRSTSIAPDENSIELMARLAALGADTLSDTLRNIDYIEPRPQDNGSATLAPIMNKSLGLIDWEKPAQAIVNCVRGFQPFPSSYTYLHGQKFTIWDATTIDGVAMTPGTILAAERDVITIACGDGTALAVHEIQMEGKRRMSTRDLLNGVKLASGEVFGSDNGDKQ